MAGMSMIRIGQTVSIRGHLDRHQKDNRYLEGFLSPRVLAGLAPSWLDCPLLTVDLGAADTGKAGMVKGNRVDQGPLGSSPIMSPLDRTVDDRGCADGPLMPCGDSTGKGHPLFSAQAIRLRLLDFIPFPSGGV